MIGVPPPFYSVHQQQQFYPQQPQDPFYPNYGVNPVQQMAMMNGWRGGEFPMLR